jgi:hypothetical protein
MASINNLKKFLNQHNNKNTFKLLPLPDGDVQFQANWILNHSQAPWLEILGIDAPYAEMHNEARALKDMFVLHRVKQSKGWRSLAVHGISATVVDVPEVYELNPAQVKYDWTEIQDRCPITVEFFKEVFPNTQYHRVRYMLMEPGGYIEPHTDIDKNWLGVAVNISLNNPDNCRVITEHGTVPFKNTGSIFLFNNYYQHAVHNDSNTDRFHMIVHRVCGNSEWNKLVVKSYVNALEIQDFTCKFDI